MQKHASLLVFLLFVMGGGITIGTLAAPGEWYANLAKPPFNPPNWIFGPVWSVLYFIIAWVGWRLWQHGERGTLMKLWFAQMGLNFLWSPAFFTLQMPTLALVIIFCLILSITLFIQTAWRPDRLSALLFAPYLAWVGFASVLNAAIFYLN